MPIREGITTAQALPARHRLKEDAMRTLDFAPLYRATVGFDRIADLMDRALTADVAQPSYPPL